MGGTTRLMPDRLNLGQRADFTVGHINPPDDFPAQEQPDMRRLARFNLPPWQRGIVWDESRMRRFVESAWRGLDLGTYSYNMAPTYQGRWDWVLTDGQQRITALIRYWDDAFPVFGYRWSEITKADRLQLQIGTVFAAYVTKSDDEEWLRAYYDRMNFGGVPHEPGQRASPPTT